VTQQPVLSADCAGELQLDAAQVLTGLLEARLTAREGRAIASHGLKHDEALDCAITPC
jgi:hypothetical protein